MKIENLKLKIICVLYILCGCASGFTADLNNDSTVNQFDLQIFCEQWLDEPGSPSADFDSSNFVDFKDFIILAAEWQGHLVLYEPPELPYQNIAPTANDISVIAVAHISKTLSLQGSDSDSYPNPPGGLKYIITYLPADVNAKVGGTKSGEQSPIRESDLPYKLSSWGSQVVFATTTTGSTSFKYKVFDGNLYSDEKTVSITITANPKDCLSFDGSGFVTVPDTGNYFDLEPNTGKALFIQTKQLACEDVLCKYQTGSPGWKMGMRNGRLRVKLYNSAGLAATIDCNTFISDGSWHHVGFVYDPNGYIEILESNEADFTAGNYQYTGTGQVSIPLQSYSNNSSLIVGNGFCGQIDNLRAYVSMDLPNIFYAYYGIVCQSRATAGTASVWGDFTLYPGASARFLCDYGGNNTPTQILDDISATHLIGTISSSAHVKYLPFVWFHPLDSAAYQQVIR